MSSVLCALPLHAATLIGNYPPSSYGGNVGVDPSQQPAVAFTTPGLSYDIDSVTLKLDGYISASTTPLVGFFTDAGGQPGSLVGSLLTNPSSVSGSTADFVFLPAATLTLSPNTTYWLLVDASAGSYGWAVSGSDTPTPRTPVGEATFVAYKIGIDDGAEYVDDSPIPSFTISATAVPVPEPSQYALMLTGLGFLGFARWRRRQSAKPSDR